MDTRIWLLAATVFLAGIAENICIGILPGIAADLHVSLAVGGQLTTIFSLTFALAALACSAWLAHRDRKRLLIAALGVFVLSNLLAAASPGYAALFVLRMVMAASCATVILLATMFATDLAPPGKQGRAIGIIFMGISGSLVLGVPVGMTLNNWLGWRAVFVAIGVPVLPLAFLLARRLPMSPARAPVSISAWLRHAMTPKILTGQLVSIAMIGGHFILFAYLTPYLQARLGVSPNKLTALYFAFGAAGVTGAWLGGWCSDRAGPVRALLLCPAVFLMALAALPVAGQNIALFLPAMMLWAGLSWSISPIVQNYLMHSAPERADASLGINVSAMHLGVALGAGLGGLLVDAGGLLLAPWAGAGVVAIALLLAIASVRLGTGTATVPQPADA